MNTTAKMFKDRLINKYLSKFSKDNINDFERKRRKNKNRRKDRI